MSSIDLKTFAHFMQEEEQIVIAHNLTGKNSEFRHADWVKGQNFAGKPKIPGDTKGLSTKV